MHASFVLCAISDGKEEGGCGGILGRVEEKREGREEGRKGTRDWTCVTRANHHIMNHESEMHHTMYPVSDTVCY